jgi:hypothetical protein
MNCLYLILKLRYSLFTVTFNYFFTQPAAWTRIIKRIKLQEMSPLKNLNLVQITISKRKDRYEARIKSAAEEGEAPLAGDSMRSEE